jgi:hypothetical protein
LPHTADADATGLRRVEACGKLDSLPNSSGRCLRFRRTKLRRTAGRRHGTARKQQPTRRHRHGVRGGRSECERHQLVPRNLDGEIQLASFQARDKRQSQEEEWQ